MPTFRKFSGASSCVIMFVGGLGVGWKGRKGQLGESSVAMKESRRLTEIKKSQEVEEELGKGKSGKGGIGEYRAWEGWK